MNRFSPSYFLSVAAVALSVALSARAERPDSIPSLMPPDSLPSFLVPGGTGNLEETGLSDPLLHSPLHSGSAPVMRAVRPPVLPSFDFSGLASPSLFSWHGGSLSAASSAVSLPGMMGIESGRLNLNQRFGNLSLTLWGGADHYGYFRGMQTSWAFGGQLDYRINDRWSLTLFGEYYSPLHPLTPGMAGYMSVPRFGGYASYEINDRWGVSVGAQAQRSLVTNRWEAQPIVMPYYKINDDVKIGVDVGGILYNMARDWIEGSNGGPIGSPVIAPPRPGPPPVAPRR